MCVDGEGTLQDIQVPVVFQEPGVYTGYRRPGMSARYYIRSMFNRNNELINVWTHLTALVVTIFKLWEYASQASLTALLTDPYLRPFSLSYVTIFSLYICSVCAHLLHSRSIYHHHVCFMFDYAGIGLFGTGVALQHLWYSSQDWFFASYETSYQIGCALLGAFTCLCGCFFKTMYDRPYPKMRKRSQMVSIGFMYLWIVAPLYHRYKSCSDVDETALNLTVVNRTAAFVCDGADLTSLSLHSSQVFFFIIAAIFYGSGLPHRVLPPSTCDLVGHGHQLFHVFISLTTYYAHEAVWLDLTHNREWLQARIVTASIWTHLWPILLALALEGTILAYFIRVASRRFKHVKVEDLMAEQQQNGMAKEEQQQYLNGKVNAHNGEINNNRKAKAMKTE